MTVSPDHDSRMLTALVQLRGALQDAPLPLDVRVPRSVVRRASSWSTSSRTTSCRAR